MSTPRESDEAAWRAIVENYGERADLGDEPQTPPAPEQSEQSDPPEQDRLRRYEDDERTSAEFDPLTDEPEPFVAPDPPLPPAPRGLRLAAWLGVVGAPVIFLICLLVGYTLDGLLSLLLVGAFVGGFCYLIATLPDHDDFDDGAVV